MDLLTSDEAAEFLHVPLATLRFWVATDAAPPSARIGKQRMWRRSDLVTWLDAKFDTTAA